MVDAVSYVGFNLGPSGSCTSRFLLTEAGGFRPLATPLDRARSVKLPLAAHAHAMKQQREMMERGIFISKVKKERERVYTSAYLIREAETHPAAGVMPQVLKKGPQQAIADKHGW